MNTSMPEMGERVKLPGRVVWVSETNRPLENQFCTVQFGDGQSTQTNIRNIERALDAEAEAAALDAETDALQETLNALLESQAAEHQADAQAAIAALDLQIEGLHSQVNVLLAENARLKGELEASQTKAAPTPDTQSPTPEPSAETAAQKKAREKAAKAEAEAKEAEEQKAGGDHD
jgi:hypothetical protein